MANAYHALVKRVKESYRKSHANNSKKNPVELVWCEKCEQTSPLAKYSFLWYNTLTNE